jgi:alpha-D-ribose 1-methylphosphonate 5-triphosphate synthase subunit PhnL
VLDKQLEGQLEVRIPENKKSSVYGSEGISRSQISGIAVSAMLKTRRMSYIVMEGEIGRKHILTIGSVLNAQILTIQKNIFKRTTSGFVTYANQKSLTSFSVI